MLNRAISTPIAIIIVLILVVLVGGFTWLQYGEMWRETSELPEIELPSKNKEELSFGVFKEAKEILGLEKDIIWQEYTCSELENLAEQNYPLHIALFQGEGAIEKNYQIVLGIKDCNNIHETINISYEDLTNDGEKDAIVIFKGSIMFRGNILGVFQFKEGNYLKISENDLED